MRPRPLVKMNSPSNPVLEAVADSALKVNLQPDETTEVDRMLLRFMESPSLLSYLNNVGTSNGSIELDFKRIPVGAVEAVKALVGKIPIEVLSYNVKGQPHTGFRFSAKDLVSANKPVSATTKQ